MEVSESDQEDVMKAAENASAEEENALKKVVASVSVVTSSSTTTVSAGGTGSRPSLSSSTPGSAGTGRSMYVSPELLGQIQQLLVSHGGCCGTPTASSSCGRSWGPWTQ